MDGSLHFDSNSLEYGLGLDSPHERTGHVGNLREPYFSSISKPTYCCCLGQTRAIISPDSANPIGCSGTYPIGCKNSCGLVSGGTSQSHTESGVLSYFLLVVIAGSNTHYAGLQPG